VTRGPVAAEAGAPEQVAVFARHRPHLLAVAFRVLGSDADAEDVVQDAWSRYDRADVSEVENIGAWLVTVVTRLCLDRLRRTREHPVRPEDLPDVAAGGPDPQEVVVLAGELTAAVSVLLEQLTPPQRVALVLHDVFGMPFEEIATVLGTSAGSAKKLASRARGRIRVVQPATGALGAAPREARQVVAAFLQAAQLGDVDGLIAVLHPEVTRTADPQALPPGTRQRLHGAGAVSQETRALRDRARQARLVMINGRPGIAVRTDLDLQIALVFHLSGALIRHYDVVADPQRLARLRVDEDPGAPSDGHQESPGAGSSR